MTASPPAPAGWYVTTVGLLRAARARWVEVSVLAVTGAVVAGATAFVLPSRYQAKGAFQAETPMAGQLQLGGLAGLFGSQLIGGALGRASSPQLLADLLRTDAVLRRVVNATYAWNGQPATLATIYHYGTKPPPLRDDLAVRKLRGLIGVDVDIRTGIVRFTVDARTPELALAVAETTLAALNDANIELRHQRASAERTFTAQRTADARNTLAAAETELATFNQRNRNLQTSPTLQMQQGQLQRSVDMAQQLFVQLQLQEEQAALEELRNTPAISVIDPPTLPVRRSWPKRRVAVLAGLLIGVAVAFVRIAAKPVTS